jgi:hypothetical protein
LSGLITGQRILNTPQDALNLLQSRVLAAARPAVQDQLTELRHLQRDEGPDSPLPTRYRTGGELWLPVRAEQLKVRLDAPDLHLRPQPQGIGKQTGDLSARAQRIAATRQEREMLERLAAVTVVIPHWPFCPGAIRLIPLPGIGRI